jgi:hypothetical protein
MNNPIRPQTYARIAGVLFLLSIIGGGFGEAYAPSTLIVSGNATATAANIHTHALLFRMGFLAYLVEGLCDIGLAWIFYILLRPVHKDLALLTAFLGIISTATFAVAEVFYFAPSFILGGAPYLNTFSADQLNAMAMLSLKFYSVAGGILMAFYGVAWIIRGYLMFQSTYLPRILGVLMGFAGLGFVARNIAVVLAPASAPDYFLLPMFVGGVALTAWMLIKGVNVRMWEVATGSNGRTDRADATFPPARV